MYNQTLNFGVNYEFDNIKTIEFDKNSIVLDNSTIEYNALIIASGTDYKKLKLTKEDKFNHNGISYCAVCDGNLYRNKKLVVVTDGMIGKEDIDYLSNITSDIKVIDLTDKYKNKNLTIYNNANLVSLVGEDKLIGIEINFNNEKIILECDGIFVAIGKETNIDLYKSHIDNDGCFLLSKENLHTNIPNVFVAGDIRKKTLRQIITACSDGAIAATEAVQYVSSIKKK